MTADVLEYEIPDDLSVVYLYNPFTGLLFARFLERLLRSLERRPRPLRLVYNYPFEHDHVIESGRFRPVDLSYSYWPAWYRRPGYVIAHLRGAHSATASPTGPTGSARRPSASGPWAAAHDPGWELVGPEHATSADAGARARARARPLGLDRQLLVGDRLERAAVQVADAVPGDRGAMLGSRVADVRLEVPARQLAAMRCM